MLVARQRSLWLSPWSCRTGRQPCRLASLLIALGVGQVAGQVGVQALIRSFPRSTRRERKDLLPHGSSVDPGLEVLTTVEQRMAGVGKCGQVLDLELFLGL